METHTQSFSPHPLWLCLCQLPKFPAATGPSTQLKCDHRPVCWGSTAEQLGGCPPKSGQCGFIHWPVQWGREEMPVVPWIEDARHCCTQFLAVICGAQLTNVSSMTKPCIKPEGWLGTKIQDSQQRPLQTCPQEMPGRSAHLADLVTCLWSWVCPRACLGFTVNLHTRARPSLWVQKFSRFNSSEIWAVLVLCHTWAVRPWGRSLSPFPFLVQRSPNLHFT